MLRLVLMEDTSRWSVARAEVKAGASAVASFQAFHQGMLEELFHEEGLQHGDFSLSLHVISQDATNGAIWQKRKLCALLLHSAYLVSLPEDGSFRWSSDDMFQELRAVADIQRVAQAEDLSL